MPSQCQKIDSVFYFVMFLHCYANENNYETIETNLSQVGCFSLGMNGFDGKVSEREVAVIDILKSKGVTDIFLRIANNPKATSESKLYAACGLKQLGKLNNNDGKSIFEKSGMMMFRY
ncbi:hypothetical protein [Serratia proteamaculans]|uniref:hypothetical protein n=2 Tax=Serratia proteamaculans TaxID=28151 RepID=UPI001E41E990|nr:hypothetical protein [Serratia proteamaculans]